ncbi:MAG: hypothetical protein CSA72_04295 [Rhodobacterales bacterium]|nr:MAG: hypothetical protein CSA72_04295 [Rhodobacterales bacterium]
MSLKKQIRIMVVDDMSVSRGLLEQALEEIGISHLSYATDGEGALRSLSSNPVHLIISDYNMPNMDGLQLLERLRQHPATQKIGFILVTGSENADVLRKGQALGMNNYLKKPFDAAALKACIERVTGPLG